MCIFTPTKIHAKLGDWIALELFQRMMA